jgi:hypothetical protein
VNLAAIATTNSTVSANSGDVDGHYRPGGVPFALPQVEHVVAYFGERPRGVGVPGHGSWLALST